MDAAERACGTPVDLQIQRLARALEGKLLGGVRIISTDLTGLDDTERNATIDAMVAGVESPYVLVAGRLVCAGAIEIDAVLGALV